MSSQHRLFVPENAVAVTPADDGTHVFTSLFVGTGGDVTVDMRGVGTEIAFANVPSGSFLPIQVTRVWSTGTTASGILGIY